VWQKTIYFLSLLFAALALAPSMAPLLELPNKIGLSRDEYLTVQQIYRGWNLLAVVVFGALLSTLALTIPEAREKIEQAKNGTERVVLTLDEPLPVDINYDTAVIEAG
jgi:hypothetical protein